MTPYEKWHGSKPDVSNLREIGSRAFVLIHEHNPKILARSIECVLIGYNSDSKTYRCYHRPSGRVLTSYHVRFIESHERTLAEPPADDPQPQSGINNWRLLPMHPEEPHPLPSTAQPAQPLTQSAPTIPMPVQPSLSSSGPSSSNVPQIVIAPESIPVVTSPPVPTNLPLKIVIPGLNDPRRSMAAANCRRSPRLADDRPSDDQTLLVDERALFEELLTALPESVIDVEYPNDPRTLREALNSEHAEQWRAAFNEELNSLRDLGVYKLIPRSNVPKGRRIMRGRPVFKLKRDENGSPSRFKVRYVCKGYEGVYGRDYDKTTSPTMRMESFRVILHLGASQGWDIQQIDVKCAYLNGELTEDEVFYMEQPTGFEDPNNPDFVWAMLRGLYGAKNSGRVWNRTMNDALVNRWGFTRLPCEYCIYMRRSNSGVIFVGVHVDDFLSTASSRSENARFKDELRELWKINDLGDARFCVGIAISRDLDRRIVNISQTALIDRIISQFNMSEAFPISTPIEPGLRLSRSMSPATPEEKATVADLPYRSLVGSLMYIAIGTRPDISFAVQQLTQFLDCFGIAHWNAAKRVVRYLKGTRDIRLSLGGSSVEALRGFSDSDYANCPDTRRSISGYCFSLGSGLISWSCRKQKTVSTSSCESEYVAASEASKEAIWLRSVLLHLGYGQTRPTRLFGDNNGALTLIEDPSFHARVKHIDVSYHFIRDCVKRGEISVSYVPSSDNVADGFTKALSASNFARIRTCMGLS
jgi:Reverse transcriptase (RNA-dependent DNA polymerase)